VRAWPSLKAFIETYSPFRGPEGTPDPERLGKNPTGRAVAPFVRLAPELINTASCWRWARPYLLGEDSAVDGEELTCVDRAVTLDILRTVAQTEIKEKGKTAVLPPFDLKALCEKYSDASETLASALAEAAATTRSRVDKIPAFRVCFRRLEQFHAVATSVPRDMSNESAEFIPLWRGNDDSSATATDIPSRIEKARVESYKQQRVVASTRRRVEELRHLVELLEEMAQTSAERVKSRTRKSLVKYKARLTVCELLAERRSRVELHLEQEPLLWTNGSAVDRELHLAAEAVRSLNGQIDKIEEIVFGHDMLAGLREGRRIPLPPNTVGRTIAVGSGNELLLAYMDMEGYHLVDSICLADLERRPVFKGSNRWDCWMAKSLCAIGDRICFYREPNPGIHAYVRKSGYMDFINPGSRFPVRHTMLMRAWRDAVYAYE
ncbi:hypothetical protein FOZ63_032866, partial [Perkinsus olseni]